MATADDPRGASGIGGLYHVGEHCASSMKKGGPGGPP